MIELPDTDRHLFLWLARDVLGWTQARMANALGIHTRNYIAAESGATAIKNERLLAALQLIANNRKTRDFISRVKDA